LLKVGSVSLDVIFLLVFFQIDIDVEAFTLDRFEEFIEAFQIYFSEFSVFETKVSFIVFLRETSPIGRLWRISEHSSIKDVVGLS